MGPKKISYKYLGLLLSVLLHALVFGLILIPDNHLFKSGSLIPVAFFVYSSVNNKTSAGSGISHPVKSVAKASETEDVDVKKDSKFTVTSENKTGPQTSSLSENSSQEGSGVGAVASSAFGDVTDDSLLTSPLQLLKEVKVPASDEAKRANVSGKVVMILLVDETGRVREVKVISGPGFGLNEVAMQAVKSFLFKPAQVKDKKVSVLIRYTYRFDLNSI